MAENSFKYDFKAVVFKDLEDEPIYPNKIEGGMYVQDLSKPPRTIADIVAQNLTMEDSKSTPEERYDNYLLAKKIKAATGPIEFTIDELAAIKKKVGENPMPLVVGRVWEVLEPSKK